MSTDFADLQRLASIVTHHRRNGQVLTQDQEEMILIGAVGLFWFGKPVFFLGGEGRGMPIPRSETYRV